MRTTHTSTECLTGNHRDSSAATTRSPDQGPIKSDINTFHRYMDCYALERRGAGI